MKNIYELLEQWANENKEAVRFADSSWTYADLYKLIERVDPDNLVSPEELNVGILLPNSIEYIVAYFSIARVGRTIVPINPRLTDYEIEQELLFCGIQTLFVNEATYRKVKDMKHLKQVIVIDLKNVSRITDPGVISYQQLFDTRNRREPLPYVRVSPQDVAVLLHTSGTTSKPKKVMLTHENLISNLKSHCEYLGLSKQDIVLIGLPIFFGYSNTSQLLAHIYLGGTIVLMDNFFMPHHLLQIIEKERITTFTAVPSMLSMLLAANRFEHYDLTSLRYFTFGGGRMTEDVLTEMMFKMPQTKFVQTYGLTEASPRVTALEGNDVIRKLGSVGKPIPGVDVKIVHPTEGTILAFNEIGEVIVKGRNVMKGYYKTEEATWEAVKEGWLHTGDLGYFDEDGYLYIKGRIKNIIISGGMNIYPEEIEETLMRHPDIRNAVVLGKEESLYGEVPIAYVVGSNSLTPELIMNYLRQYLSEYKLPREINMTEEIEQTYNGKNKRSFK